MKLGFKKTIKTIKFFPGILARHSFLTFLFLLSLDFIFAGIVFYKYVIVIEKTKTETLRTPLRFDNASYQEVLDKWEQRRAKLEEIDSKEYPSPFQETRTYFSIPSKNSTNSTSSLIFEEIIIPTSTEETSTTTEEILNGNQEESGLPDELAARLLFAVNIFDFYRIKNEKFPVISERAIIWEEKGLGKKDDYYGSAYQNMFLLQALKKELTK